jgi:putative ABC transport system permease protein
MDEALLVSVANPGPAAEAVLTKALTAYPQLTVKTGKQFKADQEKMVQGFLRFVYVLLAFSILIALIGVINTLALSVLERTREIGLLRAIGMVRRQVRSMIRGEAVVVSVLGAALGLVLGVGFGTAIVKALSSQGIGTLVIPFTTIIVVLILAALFGIFAAVFPARRAAKLDVLQAVSTV